MLGQRALLQRIGIRPVLFLCLTYLFYYGHLGVLVPYLGVFLDGRGFSSQEIGELLALITLARIIGPGLWASRADKSGKGMGILRFGALLTALSFVMVFWQTSFLGLTLVFGLMMMFWTAILPQLEVHCLNTVKGDAAGYSAIRLWGSVGFIVLTIIAGHAIDVFSSEAPIYVAALVLTGLFLSTLGLKPVLQSTPSQLNQDSIWRFLRNKVFIGFILSALLLQVSFGPFYAFFALYLQDLGYTGQQTGLLIALGVAAEVVIFMIAGRLIQAMGIKWVLIISIMLTALRWMLLGTLGQFAFIVILTQILHAFGFALTHAASMDFIHRFFSPVFHSRGQAIYVSVAFGLGGAIGRDVAGLLWLQGQGALQTFMFAAVLAVLSAMCLLGLSASNMAKSAKL